MIAVARPDLEPGALLDALRHDAAPDAVERYDPALQDLHGLPRVRALDSDRAAIVTAAAVRLLSGRQRRSRRRPDGLFGSDVPVGRGRRWLNARHVRAANRCWRDGGLFDAGLRGVATELIELCPPRKDVAQRVLRRLGFGGEHITVQRMRARCGDLGLASVQSYDDVQSRHDANAARYAFLLPCDRVARVGMSGEAQPRWLRYAVVARDVATAQQISARAAGAGHRVANTNWPAAIHQTLRYRRVARSGPLSHAQSLARRILNLPLHGENQEADTGKIAAVMAATARGAGHPEGDVA